MPWTKIWCVCVCRKRSSIPYWDGPHFLLGSHYAHRYVPSKLRRWSIQFPDTPISYIVGCISRWFPVHNQYPNQISPWNPFVCWIYPHFHMCHGQDLVYVDYTYIVCSSIPEWISIGDADPRPKSGHGAVPHHFISFYHASHDPKCSFPIKFPLCLYLLLKNP